MYSDLSLAADNLKQVARGQVAARRAQRGFQMGIGFMWAFDNYEAAVAYGGHFVANAWLQLRAAARFTLIAEGAARAQASGSRERPWTTPAKAILCKGIHKQKRKARLRDDLSWPFHFASRGLSTRRQFVRCQDTSLARYLPGQHGSLGLPLQDWQDT